MIAPPVINSDGSGHGTKGWEGTREATGLISSPEVLTEKGLGSDLASNVFSFGSGGACISSPVVGSVKGMPEVESLDIPKTPRDGIALADSMKGKPEVGYEENSKTFTKLGSTR